MTTSGSQENPSCDPRHAEILRLYQSFFGRLPDKAGANYWIDRFHAGILTVDQIANYFGNSTEFHVTYDNKNNYDFVEAIYNNVLGRASDAAGHAYWLGLINSGEIDRTRFVKLVSDSEEFRQRNPYPASDFCKYVSKHFKGATKQVAPGVVWGVTADNNTNIAFIDYALGGSLRVSPGKSQKTPGHYGGTVAINGNWFGSYLPNWFSGHSISDGALLGSVNGDARIAYIGSSVNGNLIFGHTDGENARPGGVAHAVSGKVIVLNSKLYPYSTHLSGDPAMTGRSPRTAAGITNSGYLVLVTVDGRSYGPGMSTIQLGNLLLSLGVHSGVALDGGGSSAMYISGKGIVNDPSDGQTRPVSNQLIYNATNEWVR